MINITYLIGYLKKLVDYEYIMIYPDHIIGLNRYECIISEIKIDINYTGIIESSEDISFPIITTLTRIKGILLDNTDENGKVLNIVIVPYSELNKGINIWNIYNLINRKYNILKNIKREEILNQNIRNDSTIERMLANNSASGMYVLKYYNKYFITFYKSLLSVNKADGLNLIIYDDIEGYPNIFICKFTILKKKEKYNVDIYIAYKKL